MLKIAHQLIYGHTSVNAEYRDPLWVARSRDIIKNRPFCNSCRQKGKRLNVHHVNYSKGKHLWEYSDDELVVLCEQCHELITEVIREMRVIVSFGNANNMAKLALALKHRLKLEGETMMLSRIVR